MPAPFNLARNTRAFLIQNVDSTTGVIPSSGSGGITNAGATRTTEIAILDGFSFSQASQSTTVQINEAGSTPTRGQRSFNTALDPVEFSFSTYLAPSGTAADVNITDAVLWNNLVSAYGLDVYSNVTVTSIIRSSTLAATSTLAMTAYNFTADSVSAGDVVNIAAPTSGTANFQRWTGPVKVISFSPSATACTSMVVEYLTPPITTAGTTASAVPATTYIYRSGCFKSPTNSGSDSYAEVNTGTSDKNQLLKSGIVFRVDSGVYAIDNIIIDSASIDFGVDGIATVNWTGKGAALRYISTATISDDAAAVFGGTGLPTGTAATASAISHLTNKLSSCTLVSGINGSTGTSYTLPITGGSITISNNSTYLVPATLRVVNQAFNYFVGSRSITGTLNAYLRTGSGYSANLLTDIIAQGSETKFALNLYIGGSTGKRVQVILPGVMLQVPSIETADVVSTTINFTAQGVTPLVSSQEYDISRTNELTIRAYAAA